MSRYVDTDVLAKIVFDKWQECDELKHIIPDIRNVVMCESTADVVPVVRCKNCFWHNDCRYEQYLGLDGFCSKGEGKDDGRGKN